MLGLELTLFVKLAMTEGGKDQRCRHHCELIF